MAWGDVIHCVPLKLSAEPSAAASNLAQFSEALVTLRREKSWGRRRLTLVVANELLRWWTQHPPQGTRSLAELRAIAQSRCAQLFGGITNPWMVTADWRAEGPMLCVATPTWVMEGAKAVGIGVIDILLGQQLAFAARQAPRQPAICMSMPGSAVIISMAYGEVCAVRKFTTPPSGPQRAAVMAAELRRAALREGRRLTNEPVPWLDYTGEAMSAPGHEDVVFEPVDCGADIRARVGADFSQAALAAVLAAGDAHSGARP